MKSRRMLVYETVIELGECTVSQVTAVVSRYISAATAESNRRRLKKFHKMSGGNPYVDLVRTDLRRLVMSGKLRRIKPGVYAPPLPKIFNASEAS